MPLFYPVLGSCQALLEKFFDFFQVVSDGRLLKERSAGVRKSDERDRLPENRRDVSGKTTADFDPFPNRVERFQDGKETRRLRAGARFGVEKVVELSVVGRRVPRNDGRRARRVGGGLRSEIKKKRSERERGGRRRRERPTVFREGECRDNGLRDEPASENGDRDRELNDILPRAVEN